MNGRGLARVDHGLTPRRGASMLGRVGVGMAVFAELRRGALGLVVVAVCAGCAAAPEAIVDVRPPGAVALERADDLLRRAGREPAALTRAVHAYHRALALDPMTERAHLGLAHCYYGLREWELELGEYRKSVAVNPACIEGWIGLGDALQAGDDLRASRGAYRHALELMGPSGRERAKVLYDLALVERDLGGAAEAGACLESALAGADAGLETLIRQRLAELRLLEGHVAPN